MAADYLGVSLTNIMNIIFVYNADSGKINSIFDIAHKIVSPSTYKCTLCSLTHDTLNEKVEWARFKESSGHALEFYHKDEFENKFKTKYEYPVILDNTVKMRILFSNVQLSKFKTLKDLILSIEKSNEVRSQ